MRLTDTSDLWWKTAVFYNLDVKTYLDADDDGVGDLRGLAQRLDHLAELGVTCLWLAPFYPSPQRDNGYDIEDYYGVDPRYGSLGDMVEVLRTAHDRGMRVIVDLVVNHTSDRHPWFQQARQSPDSRYRHFYQWSDEVPDDAPASMFPDVEDGVWFFDETAGQYYKHSFYRHQPDLATDHPEVREEIAKVIGFWLELGVDGFRVDAVPHLIDAGDGPEHDFLRALRGYVSRRSGHAMMLGEVNLPYDEQLRFFGDADGDELTMQFDFVANQRLYLALARQDAAPLREALESRPAIARGNQWGNFVRNHDELTLDQLSAEEREEVFAAFAPEEGQRIHGRGITRRLPSMLEGDPRRIRMVYSLMFSLPGAPVLYYGEEIGMGENPTISGSRAAVRTPMQWTADVDAGFSGADDLIADVVPGGFAPEHVNVAQQRRDPDSMLRFTQNLVRQYRASPEIGWGELGILDQPHACVLAHSVTSELGMLVAAHNFAPDGRTFRLRIEGADADADADAGTWRLVDLLDDAGGAQTLDGDGVEVTLDGYGYRWWRVIRPGERRIA